MSRCFPFPPPGYEKKARIDDGDLLKKEKHKEIRHKKEKKDKERREDRDRKDKDRSDRKHKGKKDGKEISKEKKKGKEQEKDGEKASISQEKQIPALVESCNGDLKLTHKNREHAKDQSITSNEKKRSTPIHGYIGEKPVDTSLHNEAAMDKFVLDLCNRINDERKGYANQLTEGSPFTGQTNDDRMVKTESGVMPVEKEQREDKRGDIRKVDREGFSVDGTISVKNGTGITLAEREKKENTRVDIRYKGGQGFSVGSEINVKNETGVMPVKKEKNENKRVVSGANIGGGFPNRTEEIPKKFERSIEPRGTNHKKESRDKGGSKRMDKDKEKKSHGKDKERENEERKNEKAKEKNNQKIKGHDKVKDNIKNGHVTTQIIKLPPFVPDGGRNLVAHPNAKLPQLVPNVEVNLKKRKDTEVNGFLHETNVVPNKKPRPAPHPSIENGRKLDHTPDRKVPPPNNLAEVNGKIEVQPLAISSKKPSPSSSSSTTLFSKTKANQIAKAPLVKPPHPDTKYLSKVLSVPKIDECLDFDDEDWIFSRKSHVPISVAPAKASDTAIVWAEAVQIESADVCALPYVIPY